MREMFAYLFLCSLLIPGSMILLGKRWSEKPPRDRKGLSGYRTSMSRLNEDTWNYANKYWAKVNFLIGIIECIGTVVFMIMIRDASDFEDKVTYLIIIQLVVIACTFIPTEIKLHQIFTKEGKRKS